MDIIQAQMELDQAEQENAKLIIKLEQAEQKTKELEEKLKQKK